MIEFYTHKLNGGIYELNTTTGSFTHSLPCYHTDGTKSMDIFEYVFYPQNYIRTIMPECYRDYPHCGYTDCHAWKDKCKNKTRQEILDRISEEAKAIRETRSEEESMLANKKPDFTNHTGDVEKWGRNMKETIPCGHSSNDKCVVINSEMCGEIVCCKLCGRFKNCPDPCTNWMEVDD